MALVGGKIQIRTIYHLQKYGSITVQKLFNIWLFPSVIHGP